MVPDSIGIVCGNLDGSHHGPLVGPAAWVANPEPRALVEQVTRYALAENGPAEPVGGAWTSPYPDRRPCREQRLDRGGTAVAT